MKFFLLLIVSNIACGKNNNNNIANEIKEEVVSEDKNDPLIEASKNAADATGITIVDWARSGLIEKVKESIIITLKDRWDNIPLMMDIKGERLLDTMGLMIEDTNVERQLKKEERLKKAKYDVNFRDDSDITALIAASSNGYLEIVKYLIENGANPNLRGGMGETALTIASEKGYFEIVKLLIENGANVNLHWSSGYTTKMWAAMTAGSIMVGFPEVMSFDGNSNYPALMAASSGKHLEIVKYLIENGAHVNAFSGGALMTASIEGQLEIVKLLVENGADINRKFYDGKTALTIASEKDHNEIVRYLDSILQVKKGNINAKDEYGDTALIRAVFDEDLGTVKYLIANGADVNRSGQYGNTALISALFYGDPEIVKYLVEAGADINIRNDYGFTVLMAASSAGGDPEIVKYLVETYSITFSVQTQQTYVNIQNEEDSTALIIASHYEQLRIVKYLVEQGADVNIQDKNGRTALSIISYRLKNRIGKSALDLARKKDHKEIIEYLTSKGATL